MAETHFTDPAENFVSSSIDDRLRQSSPPSTLAFGLHRQTRRRDASLAKRPLAWDSQGLVQRYQRDGRLLFRDQYHCWWYTTTLVDKWRVGVVRLHPAAGADVLLLEISAHAVERFFDRHPNLANLRGLTDEFRPMVRAVLNATSIEPRPRFATRTGEARCVFNCDDQPLVVATWLPTATVSPVGGEHGVPEREREICERADIETTRET